MSHLYAKSVPVLRHYVTQIGVILHRVDDTALTFRIADMFPAGQQLAIALGFALRATYPVCGKELPDMQTDTANKSELLGWHEIVANSLANLSSADFDAVPKTISHQAGLAKLEQSTDDYITLFALPNFFFHLSAGYTALRAAGTPLSKGDFDGLHSYPAGFSF
ncbi:MAG: DUF1993 family protein [Rhodobacteraceae bacterium]|nr:DUF1993 family protein [Paracoccaceae bacterium]